MSPQEMGLWIKTYKPLPRAIFKKLGWWVKSEYDVLDVVEV